MSPKWTLLLPRLAALLLLGCFVFQSSDCSYVFSEDKDTANSRNSIQSVSDIEETLSTLLVTGVEDTAQFFIDYILDVRLSTECEKGMIRLFRGIFVLEDWAMRIVDANGKPSAGLLEGTSSALGDYDECLEARSPATKRKKSTPDESEDVLQGKFCMVKIDIPQVLKQAALDYQAGNKSGSYIANTPTFFRNLMKIAPRADIAAMRLGVCMPSSCFQEDLQGVINIILGDAEKLITVLRCEEKGDNELQVEQIAILAVLGIISFLVFSGTLVDAILRNLASGPVDDVFFKKQNMHIQFLVSFSLFNNFKKLVKLEMEDGQLSCVRGIKFLTVCLVIVVSTYAMPIDLHFLKYRSAFNIYKFMDQWWFSAIANSSAGIDTLFFLAGLQITYGIWKKAAENSENKVSINIFKFLFVWYTRLTASQLLVIALFLMFPLIGSGPIWGDVIVPEVQHCKDTWWMNILYVNNFWPANETCLYHTWFLTALMHMLIVAPFILWILNKWNVFGILLILSLILGSCIAIAMLTVAYEMPPAPAVYFLNFMNLRWMWDKMFIQAYDHVAPFCIGILMGYLLVRNPKIVLRKITVVIGWAGAAVFNLSILFGLYSYHNGEPMDPALSAFYAAAHRLTWSIGIAWIVFACAYGYGGAISDFLSWKVFIPFERLSNFIYLLHPLVIFFHSGQVRERMYMSHLDQAVYSSAYIVFTCILAAVCYTFFSVPYKFLESVAWKSREGNGGSHNHVSVSKVIAIKERITNDFNLTMRDTPGIHVGDNNVGGGGVENNAFTT